VEEISFGLEGMMSEVEWRREYYKDNGQLYHEDPYVDGVNHGIEKQYYEDGQLRFLIPWVNGELHGEDRGYYRNGQLRYKTPHIHDCRHGIEKWYSREGVLRSETLWIRDEERNDLLGDEHKFARLILLGEEV